MPTKQILTIDTPKAESSKKRLAAYVRVSSNSEDQLHSYAAQIKYYASYVVEHPEYELVDIYADEAITGTRIDKRDEFNRLIIDCQRGVIDRIITKSVSRFARNTTELLTATRMLKSRGISVYFEEQGIDTDKLPLEMLLTFPGMIAQKESETISENMRWSYQKRMAAGEFLCNSAPYGYEYQDGKLCIKESEAAVIRRIYDLYLHGMGKQAIAMQFSSEGIEKRNGTCKWITFTIDYILNNERYMGDALLQKQYTTDMLPFRRVYNHGEREQYYIENSNPPIISREAFEMAKKLQRMRSVPRAQKTSYTFSGKLKCPICGGNYRRQIVRGIPYWVCSNKTSRRTTCCSERVREDAVERAFTCQTAKLVQYRKELIGWLLRQMEKLQLRTNENQRGIHEIDKQIADLTAQGIVVVRLYNEGILNQAEYTKQSGELNRKVTSLRGDRKRRLEEEAGSEEMDQLRALNNALENYKGTADFNQALFEKVVESITVVSKQVLQFRLLGGLTLKEYL